ncbi:hypothetical protein DIW83_14860 [Acinetobacter nosocomialis]|nr:hypothetical protein DIW83_14860 [Acinetobacter nosocomialis]
MDKPMTFNEWMGTLGNNALVHANCCRKAYEAGQQSQQAKVEELEKEWLEMNQQHEQAVKECFEVNAENRKLQKRVDKALELMQKPLIVGEPSSYVCERFKELEQALKGEG